MVSMSLLLALQVLRTQASPHELPCLLRRALWRTVSHIPHFEGHMSLGRHCDFVLSIVIVVRVVLIWDLDKVIIRREGGAGVDVVHKSGGKCDSAVRQNGGSWMWSRMG